MPSPATRPVHLNLLQIKLPIAGFMSILHRATGVFMFLATPLIIYLMDLSLSGQAGFAEADELVHGAFFTVIVFGLVWSLLHHLLAGIRYLLIDVDLGVDKPVYQKSAWAVTIAAPILALIVTGALL